MSLISCDVFSFWIVIFFLFVIYVMSKFQVNMEHTAQKEEILIRGYGFCAFVHDFTFINYLSRRL